MEKYFNNGNLFDKIRNVPMYREEIDFPRDVHQAWYLLYCSSVVTAHKSRTQCIWTAVKRVFRYIAGSTSTGSLYSRSEHIFESQIGYSSSEKASCRAGRRSTSRFLFCFPEGLYPRSQKSVSHQDFQYRSCISCVGLMCTATVLDYLHALFCNLKLEFNCRHQGWQPGVYENGKNNASGNWKKHVDKKYHLVCGMYSQKNFELEYQPTLNIVTGSLTVRPENKTLGKLYMEHRLQHEWKYGPTSPRAVVHMVPVNAWIRGMLVVVQWL